MKITPLWALLLLFIGLKLGNVITWSWLWVLSPLWVPLALLAAFFVALAVVAGIVAFVDSKVGK